VKKGSQVWQERSADQRKVSWAPARFQRPPAGNLTESFVKDLKRTKAREEPAREIFYKGRKKTTRAPNLKHNKRAVSIYTLAEEPAGQRWQEHGRASPLEKQKKGIVYTPAFTKPLHGGKPNASKKKGAHYICRGK